MSQDQEHSGEDLYTASQWELMRRKFRKHGLAVWSGMVVLARYLGAVFCEFLSPYAGRPFFFIYTANTLIYT